MKRVFHKNPTICIITKNSIFSACCETTNSLLIKTEGKMTKFYVIALLIITIGCQKEAVEIEYDQSPPDKIEEAERQFEENLSIENETNSWFSNPNGVLLSILGNENNKQLPLKLTLSDEETINNSFHSNDFENELIPKLILQENDTQTLFVEWKSPEEFNGNINVYLKIINPENQNSIILNGEPIEINSKFAFHLDHDFFKVYKKTLFQSQLIFSDSDDFQSESESNKSILESKFNLIQIPSKFKLTIYSPKSKLEYDYFPNNSDNPVNGFYVPKEFPNFSKNDFQALQIKLYAPSQLNINQIQVTNTLTNVSQSLVVEKKDNLFQALIPKNLLSEDEPIQELTIQYAFLENLIEKKAIINFPIYFPPKNVILKERKKIYKPLSLKDGIKVYAINQLIFANPNDFPVYFKILRQTKTNSELNHTRYRTRARGEDLYNSQIFEQKQSTRSKAMPLSLFYVSTNEKLDLIQLQNSQYLRIKIPAQKSIDVYESVLFDQTNKELIEDLTENYELKQTKLCIKPLLQCRSIIPFLKMHLIIKCYKSKKNCERCYQDNECKKLCTDWTIPKCLETKNLTDGNQLKFNIFSLSIPFFTSHINFYDEESSQPNQSGYDLSHTMTKP